MVMPFRKLSELLACTDKLFVRFGNGDAMISGVMVPEVTAMFLLCSDLRYMYK